VTVINTDLDRCQGHHSCVRACPVEAIRVHATHTQVLAERCIACGACVSACPYRARVVRNDVPLVQDAMAQGRQVVASVAPSVPTFYPFESFELMKQALADLGFADVSLATVGAAMVGAAYGRLVHEAMDGQPVISSSCAATVALIEKHNPDLLPYLAPVVSPMIAHGRWLKKTLGDNTFVVFVTPCIAAKVEAVDKAVEGAVDVVLTPSELTLWLEAENLLHLSTVPADRSQADSFADPLFSLTGGLAHAANLGREMLGKRVVSTSGLEPCLRLLEGLRGGRVDADLVELMLCTGGCIQGPVVQLGARSIQYQQRVWAYTQAGAAVLPPRSEWPALDRLFGDKHTGESLEAAERSVEVLSQADGSRAESSYPPEGSGSFRDRAVATIRGITGATAGISATKRQEEYMAKVVLDLTPNLVIMVDEDLRIMSMSASAERAFGYDVDKVRNQPLADILSPIDDFVRARQYRRAVVKSKACYRPDLVVEQTIVPAAEQKVLVAIMRDITAEEKQKAELGQVAQETISRTQEVINFQMQIAHEIASLLGETTAQSKIQLSRLIQLVKGIEGMEQP
jgi:PAS domain S-box-containing protein